MQVFISHNHLDQLIYSTLCMALDSEQINRWDVRRMMAGDPLAGKLREAIIDCGVRVFVATRRALEARWCMAELGAFWGCGKPVILFVVVDLPKKSGCEESQLDG